MSEYNKQEEKKEEEKKTEGGFDQKKVDDYVPNFVEKKTLEEQQKDKKSIYSGSKTSFKELGIPEDIMKGLHSMGYKRPSKIQSKALPLILQKNGNLIAQSQSGTGKTACFAIGMLETVDLKLQAPQVIVISPTLELAAQTFRVIKEIAQFREGVKILETTRGFRSRTKIDAHIVCGTPGTLVGLINRRKLWLDKIKLLVLDEADALLEAQTNALRDQTWVIKNKIQCNFRVFLFSATFQEEGGTYESKEKEEKQRRLSSFSMKFVPKPRSVILIPREKLSLENLLQYWIKTPHFDSKIKAVRDIYAELTVGQSIIFCNTKKISDALCRKMKEDGHSAEVLHSGMTVEQRKETVQKFRKNILKVLIATNVLSRGIDIPTVTVVINFDIPTIYEDNTKADFSSYLHRIGRTARFGSYGIAINLVDKESFQKLKQIEGYFKIQIHEVTRVDQIKYK